MTDHDHAAVLRDRASYDRYVALFNAADPRFTDFYTDDVTFLMFMKGKQAVLDFYARQRPFVRETLEVAFFCCDATGAAAEVYGAFHCTNDCDDPAIFGVPLKAGQVQRMHGYLLYVLDAEGRVAEIRGSLPEIVQPWQAEAG